MYTDKDLSHIEETQSEIESGLQSVPKIVITRFESNEDYVGSLDAATSLDDAAINKGDFTE